MDKKQINYVVKLVLIFIALSYGLDKVIFYSMNALSDKVYTGQSIGKANQFLKMKVNLDFIVFGSSRANHNIDPDKIADNSFNMGVDGTSLAYSAALIKLLPPKKKQTVLLHIDLKNVFNDKYVGDDIKFLANKYNRNTIIQQETDKLKQNNLLQKFYYSISYNGNIIGILKNYLRPKYDFKKYNGFDPLSVTKEQSVAFQKLIEQGKSSTCPDSLMINELVDNYLDELSLFCKSNNKDLIIFISPEYNDLCKEDNIALAMTLKKKNVPLYDFSDYFKGKNKIEYWKDFGHLSDVGAKIFTDTISSALKVNKSK